MAQSRLDILVNARNQTRGAFNEIRRELEGIDNAAAVAGRGLSGIGAVVGVGAIVAGLQQIGAELDELGRRGAIFQQLGSVLNDFAASVGSSAEAFVEAGRKGSQGTISEFDLILNANRAIQFEVAKTSEQYAQLIELATSLGRAQGISDTQALEFITTGIARESRLILDNLGLIIDLDKATAEYAATLGKQADQLTQAERKAALLAEAYRQGATAIAANRDAAQSAATIYERFDSGVQNLKDTFGELIAVAAADKIAALTLVIEALNKELSEQGTTEGLTTDLERLMEIKRELESGQAIDIPGFGRVMGANQQAIEAVNKALFETTSALGQAGGSMQQAADLSFQSADAHSAQARAALGAADALSETEAATRAAGQAAALAAIDAASLTAELDKLAGGAASSIVNAAKGVIGIVGSERAKGLAAEQLRYLQEQTVELQKQGVTGLDLIFQYEDIKNESLSVFTNIQEADKETQRLARSTASVSDAAREAKQQFDDLRSKVEGVLSGALTLDVGVNPDDILPREDAINENARRLADVAVKGFDSPWFDYFKNNFPALFQEYFAGAADGDGVKMQAAQLLRNFEEGLQPELLDKEKAKERVRRILLGEQNMAALAQEIAAELSAEFGNSISLGKIQATAGAALGVDEGQSDALTESLSATATNVQAKLAGIGGDFRAGILSALDGIGEAVANALDKQLRAESSLKIIADAGNISGQAWGSGFLTSMDSLTGQVLEKLAGLVAPYLEATQARTATLNGAN